MTCIRTRSLFAAVLTIALAIAGCGKPQDADASAKTDKPVLRIVATTAPVFVLASNIVGDEVGIELSLMIDGTVGCPHHYTLTPNDRRSLENADVLLTHGAGLDDFIAEAVARLPDPPRVLSANDGWWYARNNEPSAASLLAAASTTCSTCGGTHHHGAGHHHNHAVDVSTSIDSLADNEHRWTAVANLTAMTQTIASELADVAPQHAAAFARNAETFQATLASLSEEAAATRMAVGSRGVILTHDSLEPFARELGLNIVGVMRVGSAGEPSPGVLAQLIERGQRAEGLLILTEPTAPSRAAAMLADQLNAPVVELNPMAVTAALPPRDTAERCFRESYAALRAAVQ